MTAGHRTSEFKIALGVIVIFAIVLGLAIYLRSELLATAAIAGKAITSVGYGLSRAMSKSWQGRPRVPLTKFKTNLLAWLRSWARSFFTSQPATPAEGMTMNPTLYAAAGAKVASLLTTPLSLTAAEQADVSAATAALAKVAVDLTLKVLNSKFPKAGAVVTALIAEISA